MDSPSGDASLPLASPVPNGGSENRHDPPARSATLPPPYPHHVMIAQAALLLTSELTIRPPQVGSREWKEAERHLGSLKIFQPLKEADITAVSDNAAGNAPSEREDTQRVAFHGAIADGILLCMYVC